MVLNKNHLFLKVSLLISPIYSITYSIFFLSLLLLSVPCFADVLYTHDIDSKEYISGTYQAVMKTGFSGNSMYVDKQIKYTGELMTRFFGKVKEQRDTAHFLIDKNQIREIDWNKSEVVVFPIKDLENIRWFKDKEQFMAAADGMLKERYEVVKPDIKITISPKKESINGYECTHLTADLKLETKDLKKEASSITNISQQLWLSDDIPGFKEYKNFHSGLSKQLGVEAERMGFLNFLLQYWSGPLEPVLTQLNGIEG
ncbi:MAG: hypothetical protein HQK68_10735, partial [Desulfamplus sp.]|nr:hypothetical protein [Desulfamplus sp.]